MFNKFYWLNESCPGHAHLLQTKNLRIRSDVTFDLLQNSYSFVGSLDGAGHTVSVPTQRGLIWAPRHPMPRCLSFPMNFCLALGRWHRPWGSRWAEGSPASSLLLGMSFGVGAVILAWVTFPCQDWVPRFPHSALEAESPGFLPDLSDMKQKPLALSQTTGQAGLFSPLHLSTMDPPAAPIPPQAPPLLKNTVCMT